MSEHGYESGRLNLPFVGHCTFAKQPVCLDWREIDAHVAVLGAPFDMGTQYRAGARNYATIDVDGFDPSIAPGTGTPSHGGFLYYEVLEIFQGLAGKGDIVGLDFVEVAPDYDQSGTTAFLAAQFLMNVLGFIFHEKGLSG